MYVLVPDDPVFFAKFQSLEEPLLRHLYQLHSEGLESDDERVVSDAYDSWVRVLLKLPLWPQWHPEEASADPAAAERLRYALHSVRGERGVENLTDVFRRVMKVLLLSPPQGLLDTLRHGVAFRSHRAMYL